MISDLLSSESKVEASRFPASAPVAFLTNRRYESNSNWSSSSAKNYIFYIIKGYWPTNHTPLERIQALWKNRHIGQFVTDILDDDVQDDTNGEFADALEIVVIHMKTTGADFDNKRNNSDPQHASFSLELPAAFIRHVLHCATVHTISVRNTWLDGSHLFNGIIIDTGAAHASSGSVAQFNTNCIFTTTSSKIDQALKALVFFGIGGKTSFGMTT